MINEFRKVIGEITDLFNGELKLVSRSPSRRVQDIGENKAIGQELQYNCQKTNEILSVYMVLRYKKNVLGYMYPVDLLISADFETGRINDVLPASHRKEVKPFLFRPSSPPHNWKSRYSDISKLSNGSDVKKLIDILDNAYQTM